MPTTIAFANMKGGVGKTTLCVNLAFSLFRQGNKVLLIDNDPQFNATSSLLKPKKYIDDCLKNKNQHTIYNIYEKPPRIHGIKKKKLNPSHFFFSTWHLSATPEIKLDIIPSQIELYETLKNPSQKEYLLDRFLQKYAKDYDYIFIDCPPTPSVLTTSAFAASDFVIIPVTPSYFSTFGLPQFLGTLYDFKEDLHDEHNIKPLGIVFTNVDRSGAQKLVNKVTRQIGDALKDADTDIPIFESKMSHFKVYERTLWQAVPVHKVSGKGTHGRVLAEAELNAIATEMATRIEKIKEAESDE